MQNYQTKSALLVVISHVNTLAASKQKQIEAVDRVLPQASGKDHMSMIDFRKMLIEEKKQLQDVSDVLREIKESI